MSTSVPTSLKLQLTKFWSGFEMLYPRSFLIAIIIGSLFFSIGVAYLLVYFSPIFSIALLFALPAFLIFLSKPEYGILLVILILPLEDLLNVPGGFSAIKIISAAVFGCAILNYLIFKQKDKFVQSTQNVLIFLFVLVALLSVFVAISPDRTLGRLPKLIRVLALYFFVINFVKSTKYFQLALWFFIIGGFLCTIYGFFDPAQADTRFAGALGQPNFYALSMVPRIPIAFALIANEKKIAKNIVLVIMTTTILYGIILSGSRGGLLSISISLILYAALQKRRVLWLGLISVVFIVGIFVMPQNIKARIGLIDSGSEADNSIARRITYQIYGADLFQEHPILGIGLDGFAEAYAQSEYRFNVHTQTLRNAHNTYVEIAAGAGVIGLLVFLSILGYATYVALKYSQVKYSQIDVTLVNISIGLFSAMGGYFFGMLFGSRQYDKTLWFLLALPIVLQFIFQSEIRKIVITNPSNKIA